MSPLPPPTVSQLLMAWKNGDQDALTQLTPMIYW
jgi:hypothetical protein